MTAMFPATLELQKRGLAEMAEFGKGRAPPAKAQAQTLAEKIQRPVRAGIGFIWMFYEAHSGRGHGP